MFIPRYYYPLVWTTLSVYCCYDLICPLALYVRFHFSKTDLICPLALYVPYYFSKTYLICPLEIYVRTVFWQMKWPLLVCPHTYLYSHLWTSTSRTYTNSNYILFTRAQSSSIPFDQLLPPGHLNPSSCVHRQIKKAGFRDKIGNILSPHWKYFLVTNNCDPVLIHITKSIWRHILLILHIRCPLARTWTLI
jgi:hypothetical protein